MNFLDECIEVFSEIVEIILLFVFLIYLTLFDLFAGFAIFGISVVFLNVNLSGSKILSITLLLSIFLSVNNPPRLEY